MYLSNVQIERFRNFKRFDLEFRRGLNVIVGENNVGKTNLFDAIRIALGPHAFDGFPLRRDRVTATATPMAPWIPPSRSI